MNCAFWIFVGTYVLLSVAALGALLRFWLTPCSHRSSK